MRILFLGDVVGRPGRAVVRNRLNAMKAELNLDFCIANGENAAGGVGLTTKAARDLFQTGFDMLTTGNHIWKYREIIPMLDQDHRILRPANYPPGAPGVGANVYTAENGVKVAVLNLLGRTYMDYVDCPFREASRLLDELDPEVRVRIVDFHAEATSEKKALAYHLQDRVSAVLGTHTHVQTNDARLMPGGAAFITDVGMCGVEDSVLGMDHHVILERFLTRLPQRYNLAKGEASLQGVLLDVDAGTGAARSIQIIREDSCPSHFPDENQ